jgi:hypothetical protein
MKLSIRGMAWTCGLIWGGCVLCVGLAHLVFPGYGSSLLAGVSSIYPGFHGARNFGDALLGTGYALVDGGLGGLIFAWLYNAFASEPIQRKS